MNKYCYALGSLVLAATLIVSTSSSAETINESPKQPIAQVRTSDARTWNLQDADILSVINEVSLETGKNFVVDPRVSGKISLVSSKPIQPKEVYQVFLSVLELLGYSAIPAGNVVKIVPNMESSEMASRIATNKSPGVGDEVVVRVVRLENVSATQLLPVLRPMLPQWSNISAYAPGNILIIVGHASNLQRIMKVIANIDTPSTNSIEIIPLHQASAAQVATVLSNLENSAKANGDASPVSIASDERSNSILLSGSKSNRLKMRALVSQLDAPATGSQGNTEVIYLRYLQAKNLAPVLGKIAQNMMKTGSSDVGPAIAPAGATPVKGKEATNETNIQAETNTNAIIITAPPATLKALKTIVAKLDIQPAQVLVQAIIVELDQSELNNLGIQWGSRSLANPDLSGPGASSAVSFPPLGEGTLGIIPGTQIKAILSALQNRTGVNILSTPSVVVLDNQKAVLKVGQEVPQQTGSYATSGSTATVTPFNTIANIPVVLELDVIPQINLGSAVRLRLNLKNDTLQNPDNPGLNPIINTSQISNSVIINSDDILVIGGLMSNNMTESTDKIPVIGDIPGVGLLFQHKRRTLEKKNLVAFIKPVILYNSNDAMAITNTKYNDVRKAQTNWPENISNAGEQKFQNILPLWKNDITLPKPFETK